MKIEEVIIIIFFNKCFELWLNSVIFYINDLSVPIEDNGIRETDERYRVYIDDKIREIISEHKDKCFIFDISGTTEDRVNRIKSVLSNMY